MKKITILVVMVAIIFNGCVKAQGKKSYTHEKFAIYLLKKEIPPRDWKKIDINSIELKGKPLITLGNIVSYDKKDSVIEIDKKIDIRNELCVSVHGRLCAIVVNGKVKYIGAFWIPSSSVTFDGIILMIDPGFGSHYRPNSFSLGVPVKWNSSKENNSIGKDIEIIKIFEDTGKFRNR